MRTMVKTLVRANPGSRMLVVTGLIGFGLMAVNGILHAVPELKPLLSASFSATLQQIMLVGVMMLFGGAYVSARKERGGKPKFLDMVLEFWQFKPVKQPRMSYRLIEWAHFGLILFLFHRAVFSPIGAV